jgi:hypothetical protein
MRAVVMKHIKRSTTHTIRQIQQNESGFVLLTAILMLAAMTALLSAYYTVTRIETASTKSTKDSVGGFFAAEAGLNMRAEEIRQKFVGYNRPSGASPYSDAPCTGSDMGSGDFLCKNYYLPAGGIQRRVVTYVEEEASNPVILTIPPGERFQGLNAQEYRYTARSFSYRGNDREEAILKLRFKSRLVPLFQFAAFYSKDLEILPGPNMTLSGPVHTNGMLFLDSGATLTISGQVTTASDLYRGRKNQNVCVGNSVVVFDPITGRRLTPSCSSRTLLAQSQLTSWNNMIQVRVPMLTVPGPEVFNPSPGQVYWDKADLRIILALTGAGAVDTSASPTGVQVRTSSNTIDAVKTNAINNTTLCPGSISGRAVGTTNAFYNNREARTIRMLEIDMQALLNCIHNNNLFGTGVGPYSSSQKNLADDSEGGIVFHTSIFGPNSAAASNNYGVRVRNGSRLQATVAGAPTVKGISIISDQAFYLQGNYNSTNRIPAAVMVDSINILSANWSNDANSTATLSSRVPTATTVNAAFVAGTDTTGGNEGTGGFNGSYNGGLENYPRFHENWNGNVTFTYRGSFVSLGRPTHVNGAWVYGGSVYTAPVRNWNYDTAFNDAAFLPPITPRFVYLRQELFVRDFEREE